MQEQRLPATASKQAAGSRAFRSARTRRRPRPPHGESASRWIRTGGEAPVGGGAHAERTWGRGVEGVAAPPWENSSVCEVLLHRLLAVGLSFLMCKMGY